jgi:hypothetical protein
MFPVLKNINKAKKFVLSKYFVPGLVVGIFVITMLLQLLISLPIALMFVVGDAFRWPEYGIVVGVFAVNSLVLTGMISAIIIPLRKMLKNWLDKFNGFF